MQVKLKKGNQEVIVVPEKPAGNKFLHPSVPACGDCSLSSGG